MNREIESPVLIRIPRSLPLSIVKQRVSAPPRGGSRQTSKLRSERTRRATIHEDFQKNAGRPGFLLVAPVRR